jgi:hypothetical protein
MATTTPNFGWSVPTSTDLVKDGATAIETLGDSIDASLVDLKGGTTGQVLAKNSATDMDFVWAAATSGDITGVAVTSPITGGGTSGDVTIGIDSTAVVPSQTGNSGKYLTTDGTASSWGTISAGGWTLIASGSVGTGSTFTISSIPQTYKNIRIQLLNWSASGNGDLVWKINNTTSDTFYIILPSDNIANNNTTGTGGSGIRLSSGTVDASKTDNMGVLDILDYTNTSAFKAFDARALTWQNGSPSFKQSWTGGGAYASTSAVTSLVFDPESSSTFDAGTYYLWGEN